MASPSAAFAKALRSYETGGFTADDLLTEVGSVIDSGAPPDELIDVLRQREEIEPLPAALHGTISRMLNAARLRAESVAAAVAATPGPTALAPATPAPPASSAPPPTSAPLPTSATPAASAPPPTKAAPVTGAPATGAAPAVLEAATPAAPVTPAARASPQTPKETVQPVAARPSAVEAPAHVAQPSPPEPRAPSFPPPRIARRARVDEPFVPPHLRQRSPDPRSSSAAPSRPPVDEFDMTRSYDPTIPEEQLKLLADEAKAAPQDERAASDSPPPDSRWPTDPAATSTGKGGSAALRGLADSVKSGGMRLADGAGSLMNSAADAVRIARTRASERAAQRAAEQRAAAERAAVERAATAEKAAVERAAADVAAKEAAERAAAQRAAAEKTAADRVAAEKAAAERAAAERAAAQAAAQRAALEKAAAEKAATERAERAAAEKAAKERVAAERAAAGAREAAERSAAAERAAREAAVREAAVREAVEVEPSYPRVPLYAAAPAGAGESSYAMGSEPAEIDPVEEGSHGAADRVRASRVRRIVVSAVVLGLALFIVWLAMRTGSSPSETPVAETTPKPSALVAGTLIKDCPTCMTMTVLAAAQFKQGSLMSDGNASLFEKPQHWVIIGRAFAMAVNLVTVDEFREFAEASKRDMRGCDTYDGTWNHRVESDWQNPGFEQTGSHPVTCVSWSDADAYAQWYSAKTGHHYRLPTASEWEYAARAGGEAVQQWGTKGSNACAFANVADQSAAKRYPGWTSFACNDGFVNTAPVGSFKPNAFGLDDMLGNVFQWTQDCWQPDYRGAPVDGSARLDGDCTERELRGGSWFTKPSFVRANYRNHFAADYRASSVGFRLVRDLSP